MTEADYSLNILLSKVKHLTEGRNFLCKIKILLNMTYRSLTLGTLETLLLGQNITTMFKIRIDTGSFIFVLEISHIFVIAM